MGRPTKLTPDAHDRIIRALAAGHYAEQAAKLARIAVSTYYLWMERGRAEHDRIQTAQTALDALPARTTKTKRQAAEKACRPRPREARYLEFMEAVTHATVLAEDDNLLAIQQCAKGWAEDCPLCGGTGKLQTGQKTTVQGGGGAREQTRAEVRVCTTCDGRGRIVHDPDWRAAIAFLERRHPDRWRRRTDMVISGDDKAPPVNVAAGVATVRASADDAHSILRRIAGSDGGGRS